MNRYLLACAVLTFGGAVASALDGQYRRAFLLGAATAGTVIQARRLRRRSYYLMEAQR